MKILIAEDEPFSRQILASALTKFGFEVLAVNDGEQALTELIKPDHPRLAIIDWMMPNMDGPTLCREFRKRNVEPYVYILLLTANENENAIVEAIDAGADDFIKKPFKTVELRARIHAAERIIALQAELVAARELMRIEARNDALTGILNRRAIMEQLTVEHERCRREKSYLGVLLVDVDHFKKVNDTYGHPAGDAVLRTVATKLQQLVRPYDNVGRYGGEEFLIFVPNCDEATTLKVAERLRKAIEEQPVEVGNRSIPVTISMGVASATGDKMTIENYIRIADEGLYFAKARGRNRVECAPQNSANEKPADEKSDEPSSRK